MPDPVDVLQPIVCRSVTLEASVDEAWRWISDADELAGWLGVRVQLPVLPGVLGLVVDHDGTRRRLSVDSVEDGRRLGFTWWVEGDEGSASSVVLTVEATPDGAATTVTVVERPLARSGGRDCSLTMGSTAGGWEDRLFGLELLAVRHDLLVCA